MEVYNALDRAQITGNWEDLSAIIYEWRESAIARSCDELTEAFKKDER